ncbi:MAG: hypothetical protein ABR591_10490 [Candidatus Velthaea sp.]
MPSTAAPAGQTTSPNATTPGSVTPQSGAKGVPPVSTSGAPPAPIGHLPIIDIVPIFTQPALYSTRAQLSNNGTNYDPLDVGGTIRFPISRVWSASLDRIVGSTIDQPLSRVTAANGSFVFPAFTRDAILIYRVDAQLKRFLVEGGLSFRHRIVGGTNTSNNPRPPTISSTEHHFGYLGFTYSTTPIAELGNSVFTFNINLDTQAVDHHVGTATGVIDEAPGVNRWWETDQYVAVTVPIDPKHGFSMFAQDRWGAANFYENQPYPWRWATLQTIQLNKRFNPNFLLALRYRNNWELPVGAPFVAPNSIHVGAWDILADFKIDLNQYHF